MQKATNQIKVGSVVEIVATDNVTKRFPQLIGDHGTVEATPVHPGIWFKINVKSTGASIKIQQNALKLVRGVVQKEPTETLKTPVKSERVAPVVSGAKVNEGSTSPRPRSNSSPGQSGSQSIAFALKCGMKVAIIGTDNVVQRVPQLVDQIGIIKEAPVHPATWFKVEFPDHKIFTFRPSALRPVDDAGNAVSVQFQRTSPPTKSPPPGERPQAERKPDRQGASSPEHGLSSAAAAVTAPHTTNKLFGKGSKKSGNTLLSATDPESWVGRRVVVVGGRHNGQTGLVLSSGNGWVQVETDNGGGEVAKRAYELEIAPIADRAAVVSSAASSSSTTAEDSSVGQQGGSRLNNRTKKFKPLSTTNVVLSSSRRSGAVAGAADTASEISSTTDEPAQTEQRFNTRSSGQLSQTQIDRAERAATSTRNVSITVDNKSNNSNNSNNISGTGNSNSNGNNSSGGEYGTRGNQRARAYSDPLASKSPSGSSSSGGAFSFHNPITSTSGPPKDLFTQPLPVLKRPVKGSAIVDAKRSFIVKYVSRHQTKIGNRPDLSDWKYRIDAALYAHSAAYELEAARVFDETHCEVCNLEKWPSAKFCWSEGCPVSPVYYKLTGAPPPHKRRDAAAAAATGKVTSASQSVSHSGSCNSLMDVDYRQEQHQSQSQSQLQSQQQRSLFQDPFLTSAALRGGGLCVNTGDNRSQQDDLESADRDTVVSYDEPLSQIDSAPPSKRARLDPTASQNTSSFPSTAECVAPVTLRCFQEVIPNPVTSYLLELPGRLLNNPRLSNGGADKMNTTDSRQYCEYAVSGEPKPRSDSYASTDRETSPGSSSPWTESVPTYTTYSAF